MRPFQYCLLLFLLLAGACTNPRWMVKETQSVDPNDAELISSREFPAVSSQPSPEDPVLHLNIMSRQRYEYAEKVLMARYVQDYKVRPFFFSLGVLGAASAFYLANSGNISQIDGQLETVTLNIVGGLLTLGTAFNFKPVGEPRPTGEERHLRTTGTQVKVDTAQIAETNQDSAIVNIFYDNEPVASNQRYVINRGRIDVPLGSSLSDMEITASNPDTVKVDVGYNDSTYSYSYPLSSFLRPFARVETPVTELRNTPGESNDNILAELVEGSQLQIVEEVDQEWYKVLYGISENYLPKDDVSLVWRTSDFADQSQVVTVPVVPFGEIDVENNIPLLNERNSNGIGLVIGNENYQREFTPRKYTSRDLKLMETYLKDALGYPERQVFKLEDSKTRSPVDSVITVINRTATDSSDIFIYLSGYGIFQQKEGDYHPALMLNATDSTNRAINLLELFKKIANIPSRSTVIINNIDFRQSLDNTNRNNDIPLQSFRQPLRNRAITLTSQNERLAILFSSEFDQTTHLFFGNGQQDKKHHIFPYYFAKALQQRRTIISEIFRYLQRNVSYTSRKLHDEAEDPFMFGNQSIDLAR